MLPDNLQTVPSSSLTLGGLSMPGVRTTSFDDLDTIVAIYQPRVFRFLLANLRDRDIAETLTQETFLRAWAGRSSFREDCSIGTWLIRIALNLARDHARSGRFRFWKQVSASAVDASEVAASVANRDLSAESRVIAQQQVARVWQTVGALSARQRAIFLLRFLEEMDIPEIATVTGLPLGTVKSHLYRALTIVRSRHNPAPTEASHQEIRR